MQTEIIVLAARLGDRPKFSSKRAGFNPIIEANADSLVDLYYAFKTNIIKDFDNRRVAYRKRKECFDNKTCETCGSKLRRVPGYGFYGCPNYQDGQKHSTFNSEFAPYEVKVSVDKNWLTEILLQAGLHGSAKAKELLVFYQDREMKDLRTEFGFEPTDKMINTLVEAKARSAKQEKAATEFLSNRFEKVAAQQCIFYQLEGAQEKFCIPDFICSNSQSVWVIDAKLDYTNDTKMDLYTALIRFIMAGRGDKREIRSAHVMYQSENIKYVRSRYELLLMPKEN
jgi:hypothetical protein